MKSQKMTYNLKVALAQLDIVWENTSANRLRAEQAIIEASQKKADLIVFPEMFLTGFSLRTAIYSEENEIDFFQKLASINKIGIVIGLGIKKARAKLGTNQAIVISKTGQVLGQYQKIHPFSFSQENKVMKPGVNLSIFKINGFKATTLICYDLRFPGLFEALAKQKIDIIFVIANWPDARIEDWKTLLRARALDTQSFIVGVNRIGRGGNLQYPGYSSVYGSRGEKILEMTKAGIELIELDLQTIKKARENFPSLTDKRFDLYPKLYKK